MNKRGGQTLIGKRESFEKEAKPVKLLTKKQRRNKHCKQNLEWLLEANEENRKKKANTSARDNRQVSTTKFVLKKDTLGMGISFSGKPKRVKQSRLAGTDAAKRKQATASSGGPGKPGTINMKRSATGQVSLKINPKNEPKAKAAKKGAAVTKLKEAKVAPKMVWNSRGQCDESTKLRSKINKVRTYWNRTSLLIPNVFRHVCELKEEPSLLFEYLDLSRKELLVQANGQKAISQAGAPHLQRKNKSVAKDEPNFTKSPKQKESTRSVQGSAKRRPEPGQTKANWAKLRSEEQEKPGEQPRSDKNPGKARKGAAREPKQAVGRSAKEAKWEQGKAGDRDKDRDRDRRTWSDDQIQEKNLKRMKKQLREDLNRADQKIKESFVSKKAENWSKRELDNFNDNISKYNRLLDEQEKLRLLNAKKGGKRGGTGELVLDDACLPLFKKKLNRRSMDRVQEQISEYIKRNGLTDSSQQTDEESPEKSPMTSLTLQDILRLELHRSQAKKGHAGSLSKLSKRIHKKPVEHPKKKVPTTANQDYFSSKKFEPKKKTSQSENRNESGTQAKRKTSEDVEILKGVGQEELVVSVNAESLADFSDGSICSLAEFIRQRK